MVYYVINLFRGAAYGKMYKQQFNCWNPNQLRANFYLPGWMVSYCSLALRAGYIFIPLVARRLTFSSWEYHVPFTIHNVDLISNPRDLKPLDHVEWLHEINE